MSAALEEGMIFIDTNYGPRIELDPLYMSHSFCSQNKPAK